MRLNEAGASVSEKSGAGAAVATARASTAVCVSEPDLPVIVMVDAPAAAAADAVKTMLWAVPAVRLSEAGFAVTPDGRPVREMATFPVKAFRALKVTLTD